MNQTIWLKMAIRNLISHKIKSLIVGAIMLFGTMLVVLGTALLDSVEASMEKVVTSSLTGHFQVASDKGRDPLSLFGGLTASLPDLGEIEDFSVVKRSLESVPNVKAVVPMGIGLVTGSSGNDIDETINQLRGAFEQNDEAKKKELIARIRQMSKVILDEYKYRAKISSNTAQIERERAILDQVLSDAFWAKLAEDQTEGFATLDTKLAPLASNGRRFFLRTLGTDPEAFRKHFDLFQIEKGQMIPPKQRGILISRRSHERFLKHKIARQFDRIKRSIDDEGEDLATDETLQAQVRRMSRQYRRVVFQLDPEEIKALQPILSKELGPGANPDDPIEELVQKFLLVDAQNFGRRYDLFYKEVAPKLELYRVRVGDVVTLQSFTRRGYVKSVNVKVWGTFSFKGLEESDLAGVVNVMDMLTFRQMYGQMTDAQRAELASIREEVGVEDVKRAGAEDALFGQDDSLVEEVEQEDTKAPEALNVVREALDTSQTYTQRELEQGLAINAAVILADPTKHKATEEALRQKISQDKLGLKLVNWQSAAGIVGQLILVIRIVLYIAIFIIFLVAMVIMNNAMVMATVDRVAEIGTMRAIGAERGLILRLFLAETLMLGAIASSLGIVLGLVILAIMNHVGIPATNDIVRFLFAGPRLHPTFDLGNIVFALIATLIVSIVSTLYPAILATRIQPVVAMRGRE